MGKKYGEWKKIWIVARSNEDISSEPRAFPDEKMAITWAEGNVGRGYAYIVYEAKQQWRISLRDPMTVREPEQ